MLGMKEEVINWEDQQEADHEVPQPVSSRGVCSHSKEKPVSL